MEDQKTYYGLVGYPVSHSLSPLMHNTAFAELGIKASYELFPLKEEELEPFFNRLKEKSCDIQGINVTVPYKEKVIGYLNGVSPYAQKAKAVNTVVISPQRSLQGFNTDGPGFLTHLTELGFDTKDKKIAMIGCGGVARAIVSVLCLLPERPKLITIYDVQKEKADGLISDLGSRLDVSIVKNVGEVSDLGLKEAQLLINATPIGLKEEDPCIVDEKALHEKMLVYDVIYNPLETKLLKAAKKKGAKTANGLKMLYYQGVLAFQHWMNAELEPEVKNKMWQSLVKGLSAH
ncbi:MAG: shikimate dehydrogenase [Candidatus Omnitrophota bacterium]